VRGVVAIAALATVAAGTASAIIEDGGTFPSAWVYDGLITYDHMGLPLVPNALHFNTGASYIIASKTFDEDGKGEEMAGDRTLVAVPVDVGYAINDRILVDVTLQLLSYSEKWDGTPFFPSAEYSAAGLGDLWLKGRYIAPLGRFNVGGRLGVKVPVGKVDYFDDDNDPELGDGQLDVDVAAVGSIYPDRGFAFNGQVGFRYRTVDSNFYAVNEMGERVEIDYKPGLLTYLHLEPGYSVGPESFQVYVPVGFMTTTPVKMGTNAVADSNTRGLYVGLAPRYALDVNNTLGAKFLYPVTGKGAGGYLDGPYLYKAVLIGLTYEGYVPF